VTVIEWLLDSDPAIRWQVMRDLTHEPADVVLALLCVKPLGAVRVPSARDRVVA
jgi:hypothetical protein